MTRLAGWVIAITVGLFTNSWCQGQELDLTPGPEKGVMESGPRNRNPIQKLDLLADPVNRTPSFPYSFKAQVGTLESTIIITEEEEAPLGLPEADLEEEFRSAGGIRAYPVGDLVIPLQSDSTGHQPLLQAANAQRAALIESLQALQDAYCRNAQLDEALAIREMIRQLKAQARSAAKLPEPLAATPPSTIKSPYVYVDDLRGQNGKTFFRQVTGSVDGYVWGGENNIYTDDSVLATAAVHAGVLKPGETGMVRFTILAGKDSYVGSTRNDVTTRPYHSFGGSFRIDGAAPAVDSVYHMRGQDKPPFAVYVVGSQSGTVYGTGSYTDDSSIATAAVHAGLLKPGETGFVMVTLEGGKNSYEASTQNGVTTYSYGSWSGGFRLSAYATAIKLGGQHIILDVF